MKVSPRALNFDQKPTNGMQRNPVSTMGAFVKTSITSALEKVFSSPITVRMENEKAINQALSQLISGINEFNKQKKDLQIGKASLTTQKIDAFEVSNLENLTLQNVEKLSFAFEQLKPIIASLQAGNRLDQQSVSFLRDIKTLLSTLGTTMRDLESKEMVFPVEEIVNAIKSLESRMSSLKLESPQNEPIKFPAFPKSISMLEGKAILKSLQMLSDKIDELPKSYPELTVPKTVSVDNFPPQKYPMPVTNININPLKGTAKSNFVTVGTTPTPLPSTPLANRRSMIIFNNGTGTIYLGGSDVTSTNGLPVPASTDSPALDAAANMIIYGISSTGTNDVRILEVSSETIAGHTVI